VQWTVSKLSVLLSYWLIDATNAIFLRDLIFNILKIFNCICCHANRTFPSSCISRLSTTGCKVKNEMSIHFILNKEITDSRLCPGAQLTTTSSMKHKAKRIPPSPAVAQPLDSCTGLHPASGHTHWQCHPKPSQHGNRLAA